MRVAFIGLGWMGFPIAGHLASAGHAVTVHNRSPEKAAAWLAEYRGTATQTVSEAVEDAEIVFTCLTDGAATHAALLGPDGALGRMRNGAILIDHASATPAFARELGAAADLQGVGFLDAPVTGGVPGAIAGTLGIMVGGNPGIFAAAAPVMQDYAGKIALMGPVGSGHLTKLVNVVCGVGMSQALAEGLAFGKRAGLDMDRLIDVLMAGSTRSYLLEKKGPAMAAGAHSPASFTVDLVLKDIAQALGEARRLEAKLPVLALVERFYSEIKVRGGGSWDTSSLISLLE
jgi:3-hydroxyisobutyrate dehydrogenase-like beta-hydroxyacid dehydrogenase